MKRKTRYLVELKEPLYTEEQTLARKQALEDNPRLKQAARRRRLGNRDDRWWSVVAGLLIVALFAVYSAGWNVAATVCVVLLCAFMAFVLVWTLYKRATLKYTPREISAGRCADALFHAALNLPFKAPELKGLIDPEETARFGQTLRGIVEKLAKESGVPMDSLGLRVDTAVTEAKDAAESRAAIPVVATVTVAGTDGSGMEVIFEYCPVFALASTGDCMLMSLCPEAAGILARDVTLPEERPYAIDFVKCALCGHWVSERWLRADEGRCPVCGKSA